jgi:hypothetical protein
MPSIGSRARLGLLALSATGAMAAGIASGASGASVGFCGSVYTAAHGWCYNGAPFGWRYVEADYYGGGNFGICAAVNNYYTRVTRFKDCRNIVTSNGYAGGCYTGGDTAVDPGVGNQDDNRHTINGYANNFSC